MRGESITVDKTGHIVWQRHLEAHGLARGIFECEGVGVQREAQGCPLTRAIESVANNGMTEFR